MPVYQLQLISHISTYNSLHALLSTATKVILEGGGVVRNVSYWGKRALPQVMINRTTRVWQNSGAYTEFTFHANPKTLQTLQKRLKLEPTVLRATTIRTGSGLKDVVNGNPTGSVIYPSNVIYDKSIGAELANKSRPLL